MNIHELVFSGNVQGLEQTLKAHPELGNAEIALPNNVALAHPLHRICDGVAGGYFSEEVGLVLAKLFVRFGADVNTVWTDGKDSPLTTACSLACDKLALYYIKKGARVDHRGFHGGTALHWAAWCGRDTVIKELLKRKADVNKLCVDFRSTPLFWAIHGYIKGGEQNRYHQVECARLLLANGADASIPNFEGRLPQDLLGSGDQEMRDLFS